VLLPRISDELPQQQAANAGALPRIRDADAQFRSTGLIRFAIACDADKMLDSTLLHRGHEGHPLPIVDVHELVEQVARQELQRREQAKITRALRKAIDIGDFALAIVLAQRPDADSCPEAAAGARHPSG
jgi:hypothetical protein